MIRAEDWIPADGLILEPNALLASKEDARCLALTAGPGAGKTEMLAQRADFLLRTGTCRYPKRILAISFKVDASHNLKDRVYRRCGVDLSSRFDSYTFHAFAKRIIDRFRPVLTGDDALDADYSIASPKVYRRQIEFGDLVPLAIQILKNSRVALNAVRQTYTDVFLDEFQDCTNLQYELVKVAFQGTDIRLTAVGDTKQKIMAWAGALDGIFSTFSEDFAAAPLNMYRNFRSKPRLLRVQNEIIRDLDAGSVMPDEQLAGDDGEISICGFDTALKEAEYIADQISAWVNVEGIPLSEIAVLVSKQIDLYANCLIEELENRGIPCRNEQQLQDMSVEPVSRLIVDYLLCLYGKQEPEAWVRLMDRLQLVSGEEDWVSSRQSWQRFIGVEREKLAIFNLLEDGELNWWKFSKSFLNEVGYESMASLSPEYETKARLKEIVKETKRRIDEQLDKEPDIVKALTRFSDDQAVRILTIHKSKGLEFDSVVIMAVEQEIFFGDPDENRCAFFVGVSRAKRRLVLSCAASRPRPAGHNGYWRVSRTPQYEFFNYAQPFVNEEESLD